MNYDRFVRRTRGWLERWDWLTGRWINLLIALGVAVVAFIGALALVNWLLKLTNIVATETNAYEAARIGYSQLAASLVSIALTVFFGVFVLREFVRNEAKATLALEWGDPHTEELVEHLRLDVREGGTQPVRFEIRIVNFGNLTALWYKFELQIPFCPPTPGSVRGDHQPQRSL